MYNLFEKFTNKSIKVISELLSTKTNTIHNNVDELHKLDIFFIKIYIFVDLNILHNIISIMEK